MGFKEQAEADLSSVFLNLEEFAEDHVIEGNTVACVIQTDALVSVTNGKTLSVSAADCTIFAKSDSLPAAKSPGSFFNLDGKEMIIVSWDVACGLAAIGLRQNRQM